MKKPAIPAQGQSSINAAVRETLQILTGQRGQRLTPLPPDATLAEVVTKVNALITLLQET